ncbi:type II toxin-antitoxin system HicA family toxin [bacterium]|nr:type II toxin-antitoxin system HicA family toxin [bacterium]MBU1599309.1 type II toxin-antitoxin system HicA family toxin [bacterium]MBU2462372.1 type II toxin-antitoxin system HicA family toxin [bacterium]
MAKLSPCSREDLAKKLKKAGFNGPYPGGKYSWMEKKEARLIIPNPHLGDIDIKLIRKIIKYAGIKPDEWLLL